MTRDHDQFDPYAAFNAYLNAGQHRRKDGAGPSDLGTVKSIAEMARDLQCSPAVLPAESYIRSATGATWEELRGLPPATDVSGRPRSPSTL
jgi:hypothetical protein